MTHIMLICSAGISTTVLVKKIEEAANKQNREVQVFSVSQAQFGKSLELADVILLGPQVRYLVDEIRKKAGTRPVAVIDMQDYGLMNGEAILSRAMALLSL